MRFPEFSGEWETSILLDVCEINPKTPSLDEEFVYIDLESVEKGTILHENVISRDDAPSRAQRVLKFNDILFQCVRPYQKNNLLFSGDTHTLQYVASTGYAQIRTDKQDPAFLYQLLNTQKFVDQVMLRCTGTSYPAINANDLSKIPICYPLQIEEQNKIAKLLSMLDQRIETQKKIIEDLKKLKDAITHSHYRNELSHSPMAYIGQYITQVSKRNKDARIDRVLSVSNKYGFINQDEQFEDREVASADTSNYKVVHKGDFAYNPARINVGSVARLQEFENGIVSPMYVCFTAKKGLLPAYFELYLSTNIFKHEMNKRLEGSVRLCLTYESLCNIKIALPEFNVQKDFVSKVSTILTKIKREEKLLVLYHNYKQYLLSQMFI